VLQDHLGERTALLRASPQAWAQMTPLMEVVARGGKMSAESIKAHVRALKQAVGQRPVYLDIKKLEPCTPTQTSDGERPALEILHEAARARGLAFMPVVWTSSNEEHLGIVANTNYLDSQGLALRHRVSGVAIPNGITLESLLKARLEHLRVDASEVDLLLDLEYLDLDSEPSARWVAGLVTQSARAGTWRSIVLIATSVPSSFGNGIVPEHSAKELPRREWTLWRNVVKRVEQPVAFGDYAVQNPVPPPNPPPIGPWANIRYTLEETLFVARGFDTRTRGTDQYAELSTWVTSHPSFRGGAFSHGDSEIATWSASGQPQVPLAGSMEDFNDDFEESAEVARPASPTYWRGVGTSHHLEQVTEQLRQS